jgi:hypothetical protein
MRVEAARGAMAVDGLGTTLMHEYVFVLTPDVMQNYRHEWRWDEQDRRADAVRQLHGLKDAGVDSVVDPTAVGWPATSRRCSGPTSRWTSTSSWRQASTPITRRRSSFTSPAPAVVIGQRARGGCPAVMLLIQERPPGAVVRAWCPKRSQRGRSDEQG